jgi:lipopolysaccharide export system protein LptA
LIISYLYILLLFSNIIENEEPEFFKTGSKMRYTADELVGSGTGLNTIREYNKNVKIYQSDMKITCDHAIWYLAQSRSELSGRVVLVQDEMTLKAPKLNYDEKNKKVQAFGGVELNELNRTIFSRTSEYSSSNYIAEFFGEVRVESDTAIIQSAYLKYNRKTKSSLIVGNSIVKGKTSNFIITADTIIDTPSETNSIAKGHPVLYQIDTTKNNEVESYKLDTLTVSSGLIVAYRKTNEEMYYFYNKVEICKVGLSAKSDTAIYDKQKQQILLLGKPTVWYDSTQLNGDTILITLDKNKLKQIYANHNAFTAIRNDTTSLERINQIIGNEIFIEFKDGKISKLQSFLNAKSLYFVENNENENRVARNGCDSIVIDFDLLGKPENITWLGSNTGEYLPENIIADKIKQYYLPKFNWIENRPKRKVFVYKK